jgi:integrase
MSKPPELKQHKNEKWYVAFREDGRSKRVSLRTTDQEVATLRFSGWLKDYKLHTEVVKDPTVEFCLDLWMSQWIEGRMLSEVRYPAIVNNLNAYFGNMPVSTIEREHAKKFIELRANGIIGSNKAASGTIRGELQRLRACLRFMNERVEPKEQRISSEIIPYIDLPPPSPPRDRVLTEDEVQLLRDTCSNHVINGPGRRPSNRMSRVGRFVMLAMETAQRKTAIEQLRWDQVSIERNQIQFNPQGRLQSIKRRPALSISPMLKPVLERAKSEAINDYVLDKPSSLYEAVRSLGQSLNIDDLHPHVFRHTWATRAITRGVPIEKVAKFMGDTVETVRKNYEHLAPDYLDDVHE